MRVGGNLWTGIDHAIHSCVDPVARGAGCLRGNVESLDRAPNEFAVRGGLDRHHREFLGREAAAEIASLDDLSVRDRPIASDYCAVARHALLRWNPEKPCSLVHERNAPRCARVAKNGEGHPNRPAASRHHQTPFRIGVDGNDANVVPIGLEFIGENAGERGADMLSHLGANDIDANDAVRVDAVPDGRLEDARRRHHGRIHCRRRAREAERAIRARHAD